ncbi:50S ribosomal protein L22 [Fodinibius sp. AD559]|uniref:50S ribosomal protein L22 n=1 Tax=Fodinibius sp. AD559 TaxID=3424179 RepID=UPI004046A120
MAEETLKARATQKHLRRSPRKVRLVVDSVRGDRVDKALKKLEFTNKGSADEVAKVVKSAAANIRDKFQEARLDNQEIYISEIFVNEGATLKRIQPRAMGRANQIRKRTSHITVVVANNKELVNQ